MIKSGAKVSVDKTDEGTVFTISPEIQSWQTFALVLWIVVWLACGLVLFFGAAINATSEQKLYLMAFAAFWAYFLFYSVRTLMWHRSGVEYLRVGRDTLDYKRSWRSYGKVFSYDLQTIRNLGMVNYGQNTFVKTYHDAFWTIGGEMIGFEYIGKKVVIGRKLAGGDAKRIIDAIEAARRQAGKK